MTVDDFRARCADFHRLPPDVRAEIDRTRILPVAEFAAMLDQAIAEDWYGNDHRLEPDVRRAIKRDLTGVDSMRAIARRHGVAPGTVRNIKLAA